MQQPPAAPELIPGLEEFWAPDESAEAIERDVERLPPRFAMSRPLPNDYGIIYRGCWETLADGVCTAVRRNACALRRAKMPVFLQSPTHMHWNRGTVERSYYCELPQPVLDEVGHLTEPTHRRTIGWIEHFVPTLDNLIAVTRPSGVATDPAVKARMLKSTAAYFALEHAALPEEWVRRFNLFGRLMVPCGANRDWLQAAGVTVPVQVVVHPLGLRDPFRSARRAKYQAGTFRILSMGKWEPRKSQHLLIGAFFAAFTPDDDVQLVIKSSPFWNAPGYPADPKESFAHWLAPEGASVRFNGWTTESAWKRIEIHWGELHSREQLADFYSGCHGYAQCGLTEGFDLCALDAKVAGLRLAAVAYGGPSQFVTPDDERVSWTSEAPPPKQYRAPEGTRWPDPNVRELADALRRLYERRAEPVPELDIRPYLLDSVGSQLRESVNALAENVGLDVKEYAQ